MTGRLVGRALLIVAVLAQGVLSWRAAELDRLMRAGRRAYEAGRYEQALATFERARVLRGADPAGWAWQGDAADALSRATPAGGSDAERARALNEKAWAGYAGAVLRSPLDTWSWCGIAETALRRADILDREHGVDLTVLDRRSRGVLDPWRAIAFGAAKTAVTLKPSGFQELDVLSRVYRTTGQLDAALKTVVRSARMMPAPSFHDWGEAETFVAPIYRALLEAMLEGVSQAPAFERSALHREIGRFALRQDDPETALREFRAAIATSLDPDGLYHGRRGEAQVLERLGRIDEAVAVWDAVIASGVAAPSDRRQRGILLRRAGRNTEACRDLRDAVHAEPQDDPLRLFASSACEAADELEAAERLLRDGFVTPTEDPALARALVDFCMRVGKRSTAEGLLRSWARDYPDHEEFARWLGEVIAGRP